MVFNKAAGDWYLQHVVNVASGLLARVVRKQGPGGPTLSIRLGARTLFLQK